MSEVGRAIVAIVNNLKTPIYAGWSIFDLIALAALLFAVGLIINYFFEKAGS